MLRSFFHQGETINQCLLNLYSKDLPKQEVAQNVSDNDIWASQTCILICINRCNGFPLEPHWSAACISVPIKSPIVGIIFLSAKSKCTIMLQKPFANQCVSSFIFRLWVLYIIFAFACNASSACTTSKTIDFRPMVFASAIAAIMHALIPGPNFPALLNTAPLWI